jgi:hypothetical protein
MGGELLITRMQLKKDILSILQQDSLDEIFEKIAGYDPQQLLNPLFSALCHREEKVRWSAVLCFGRIVSTLAERDMESARIVMRRFLWSLNDESGGIGWGAPESMAEVMCHSAALRREYIHMLISYMREDGEELFQDGNYLELPMLQRGLLWGIGRLCQHHKEEMLSLQIEEDVAAYLTSADLYVKGYALWCLYLLGCAVCREKVAPFVGDDREVLLFIDHRIESYALTQLASRVLAG